MLSDLELVAQAMSAPVSAPSNGSTATSQPDSDLAATLSTLSLTPAELAQLGPLLSILQPSATNNLEQNGHQAINDSTDLPDDAELVRLLEQIDAAGGVADTLEQRLDRLLASLGGEVRGLDMVETAEDMGEGGGLKVESRSASPSKAKSTGSEPDGRKPAGTGAGDGNSGNSSASSSNLAYTTERATELKENIEEVAQEVEDAYAGAAEGSRHGKVPRLVAVSKLKPASDIQALYDAGYRHFGENYIQEMVDKAKELPDDIQWHFIGNLQSNKAKVAAAIPNLFVLETLSSSKTALALNKARASHSLPPLGVYIQINTSDEDTKSGVPALSLKDAAAADSSELYDVARTVLEECESLQLKGLMTIGSFTASHDPSKPNPDFLSLKSTRTALLQALKTKGVKGTPEEEQEWELSMGMSADFEVAVREGSGSVRVGTRIFGERPKKVKAGDGGGATK